MPNLYTDPVAGTDSVVQRIKDYLTDLNNAPRVRLTKSAAQSIPGTGAETAVTWDAEAFDSDGMHSTVTNTARITIVTPGAYLFGGSGEFAASAAGTHRWLMLKHFNASGVLQSTFADDIKAPSATAFLNRLRVHPKIYRFPTAGHYVEMHAAQDSGAALNFQITNFPGTTYNMVGDFWAVRVGAA